MTDPRWRVTSIVRKVRAEGAWSLREAARRAGCSHVFLADIEAERRHLSARRAVAIAEAWGIDRPTMERAWLDDERDRAMAEMLEAQRR